MDYGIDWKGQRDIVLFPDSHFTDSDFFLAFVVTDFSRKSYNKESAFANFSHFSYTYTYTYIYTIRKMRKVCKS